MTDKSIEDVINTMKYMYNSGHGVIMEIEGKGQRIKFLENELSILNDKIEIEYFNKNEEKMENENKQKIIRFKSWKTYEPQEQKLGIIIGFMVRIERLSRNENTLLHNIINLIKKLYNLGYAKRIINNALYKMQLKMDSNIWKLARSFKINSLVGKK